MSPAKPPLSRLRNAGAAAKSVRVPKTAELIADTLRGRIARGELGEGDSLASEAELTAEFKVSRASLREALRILEAESLIVVKRGARGGAKVQLPREENAAKSISLLLQMRGAPLRDLFAARLIIEPPLVGQLARNRSKADIAALRRHIDLEQQSIEEFWTFATLAAEMHRLLMRLAGNVALTLVVGMLDELYMHHLMRFIERRRPDQLTLNKHSHANHQELLRLIEARDAEGAEVAWRHHLQQARDHILAELGEATTLAQV